MTELKKYLFLDRDGVINRDSPNYIKGWDEFVFIDRSLAALRLVAEAGYEVIVITNQSAVNRGLIPEKTLIEMHARMMETIHRHGGKITDVFYCPHTPAQGCGCRKPKPGLIRQAMRKYPIDPALCAMIGDSPKDVECARNAACGLSVLVKSGCRKDAEQRLFKKGIHPDMVADDLYDAVCRLFASTAPRS